MKEKKFLFTPGPINTSPTVKQAMLRDVGSREPDFLAVVRDIRHRLLALSGVSQEDGYEAIPMQGSGTFAIESVICSTMGPEDRLLVLVNGAYGRRIHQIAQRWGIRCDLMEWAENQVPELHRVEQQLASDPGYTHLAAVHCETTSGIVNPVELIGRVALGYGCRFMVDAMSSFAAIPVDVAEANIDFLVASANKCLEAVPGFAFVIANRVVLQQRPCPPRTLSLDLLEQWQELEASGQFRFTPPTHAMLACHQALVELEQEGGIDARAARYRQNQQTLLREMSRLGFRAYVPPEQQSPVITAFGYPADPKFNFEVFCERLGDRGMVIYPGKVARVESFRIGSIGQIGSQDVEALVGAVEAVLGEMGVRVPIDTARAGGNEA